MMQNQFITPIKFWLAGVIAITVLFAGCSSTTLIKGHDKGVGKNITETKEWVLGGEAPQIHRGKKICLRIDPETGCNRPVKCKGGAPRTDGKLLKDFLKLPDSSPNPHITVPGHACHLVIIDDRLPDSYQVCIYIPGVGTQCFTFN